jgi:hypothetical protein
VAIFLASAAFGVLQHLQADGTAEVFGPDQEGSLEQCQQVVIRRIQYGARFGSRERFVVQGFLRKHHIVGHLKFLLSK